MCVVSLQELLDTMLYKYQKDKKKNSETKVKNLKDVSVLKTRVLDGGFSKVIKQ